MADRKPLFIPDASVLLKWATYETEDLHESILFEGDVKNGKVLTVVPSHCLFEICNMLGRNRQDIALSFFSYLLQLDIIEEVLTLDRASVAFHLMKKYIGVSFYDACYHAFAIQEAGIFLTADERYYRKTKKEGAIMLLKDYGKRR